MTDGPPPPEPRPSWGTPSTPPTPPPPPGGDPAAGSPPPPPPGRPASPGGNRRALFVGLAVLAVLLLVGGVVAVVAATGGDDGEPPGDYATDVCGAVGDWQTDLQDEAEGLQGGLETAEPAEVQDVLVGFLDGAVERTDGLITDIEDAGFPSGDGGEDLAEDLQGGLEQARDLFRTAAEDAEALDPDDRNAFGEGVQRVGENLTEGGQRVEQTFDDLRDDYEDTEVSDALSEADACNDLEGGGLS